MVSFFGAGKWDDEAVMAELCRLIHEELAEPNAILIRHPRAFPKLGTESCGMARLWCGAAGWPIMGIGPRRSSILDRGPLRAGARIGYFGNDRQSVATTEDGDPMRRGTCS